MYSLIVEDDGIGMSAAFMKRMFEPFTQEKRSEVVKVPGTGLGLSIVKSYVDLMGGTISVESHLHQGTRFVVTLPIHLAAVGQEETRKSELASEALRGKQVLVCEDNRMNIEIISTLLRNKGILVEIAENGRAAVDLFTHSAVGHFDAILMDIRMPVMDGLAATRAIRSLDRKDANIPIIAMTADAFEENVREAKEAGMNGYVMKPVSPRKLVETLWRCIRQFLTD